MVPYQLKIGSSFPSPNNATDAFSKFSITVAIHLICRRQIIRFGIPLL
jgi:hypothetical protein